MNKRINIILLIGAVFASVSLQAQTTFYLDGYGRALTTTDRLKGDLIENDTTGVPNKGVSGYTLFDLGLNLEKDKTFKVNAILRARNEFGLFWGQGTDMEFRQIRLEGVIGKGIKYEIGDVYVEMTPYTLYNSEEMYNEYESQIFAQRRNILEYENFIQGNSWRLQGVKSYANILFNKGIDKLGLYGFGVRTQPANQIGQSDRIMAGLNATVTQSEHLKVGFNYVGIQNLTISTSLTEFSNHVGTATLDYNRGLSDDFGVFLNGETGTSSYSQFRLTDEKEVTKSDIFYDGKLGLEYKPLMMKLSGGYKYVGAKFTSPGAQTTRFNQQSTPRVFDQIPDTLGTNGSPIQRYTTLYDRFTNEGAYVQGISDQLLTYAPQYTNINPYGRATPNRTGLQLNLSAGDRDSLFQASVGFDMLKEIEPDQNLEGNLRNFTGIQGGVLINVNRAIGFDRDIVLTAGYRSETTTRGGVDEIDLTSVLMDLGVSVEVLPSFDLMAGYKALKAEGNEYVPYLNEFNQYTGLPYQLNVDTEETMVSFGARFRFSENAALTANYNLVSYTNNKANSELDLSTENASYDMSQLFISYIMKF